MRQIMYIRPRSISFLYAQSYTITLMLTHTNTNTSPSHPFPLPPYLCPHPLHHPNYSHTNDTRQPDPYPTPVSLPRTKLMPKIKLETPSATLPSSQVGEVPARSTHRLRSLCRLGDTLRRVGGMNVLLRGFSCMVAVVQVAAVDDKGGVKVEALHERRERDSEGGRQK
ncbi:hypothetical protein BJ165DRAFT_330774 [Panaeolus papilionaceus]|nr:hypothetical protein BJ165DRAFT_330774 [Panaeolus papilionaceus]